MDADGNGAGDFAGLTSKLDYLHDLGVDCLWILPMYPSPLRDDGYDIADFYGIHPSYGSVEDFQKFLDAAHDRGLRVIADLVMNHTSDAHPWFQAARSDPASPYHGYYVWSDSDRKYREARIIFTDTEKSNWTFDPVAKQYYWHRFFSHQPDLNYDNPAVKTAMLDVMRFWLDRGLDGFRCDAVPYLIEREGTSCENLPQPHPILTAFRRRLAPLMDNDRRRIELLNCLLLTLPGSPIVYYGDEIGMGDNVYLGDRNGVRTPMQWSDDRNAGFSSADPAALYLPVITNPTYHYQAVNVAAQEKDPASMLNTMRRLIAARKRSPAWGRGTIEFLRPRNQAILAYLRAWRDDTLLVVANLSARTQPVELDLTAHEGAEPIEMLSGNRFPRV